MPSGENRSVSHSFFAPLDRVTVPPRCGLVRRLGVRARRLHRQRQRLAHAAVVEVDEVAQPLLRAVVERTDHRVRGAPALCGPGVRRPVLVGVADAQREQVEPGPQPVLGGEAGVADRTSRLPQTDPTVPVSRRPPPRSTSTSTVADVRPRAAARAADQPGRGGHLISCRACSPSAAWRAGRRAAARLRTTSGGSLPASTSASIRSPIAHFSSAVEGQRDRVERSPRPRAARSTSSR